MKCCTTFSLREHTRTENKNWGYSNINKQTSRQIVNGIMIQLSESAFICNKYASNWILPRCLVSVDMRIFGRITIWSEVHKIHLGSHGILLLSFGVLILIFDRWQIWRDCFVFDPYNIFVCCTPFNIVYIYLWLDINAYSIPLYLLIVARCCFLWRILQYHRMDKQMTKTEEIIPWLSTRQIGVLQPLTFKLRVYDFPTESGETIW